MKGIFLPIVIFAGMLHTNLCSGQQIPPLGLAASYGIFTAVGAINNGGNTIINGDIGTNAGAFNGFPAGVINGQTHVVDPTSLQVATDVTNAYTLTGNIPCDSELAPGLGNNQVLLPMVYCINAASTLNGDLILDGNGDPNAIFVFKMVGAFATGITSHVILINSASFANVYWRVQAGQIDLGNSSIFGGTILADGGSLNLALGASLQGRGLVVNGAVNMSNNMVTVPLGLVAPLPVRLLDFTATRQGSVALLEWRTATENDSRDFSVERSNSGQEASWKSIGTLPAAGISTSEKPYMLVDEHPGKGSNYYRLRCTNTNGTHTFSKVEMVLINESISTSVQTYPNPVINSLTVTGVIPGSTLILTDMLGKIQQQKQSTGNNDDQIGMARLPSGIYILKIVSATGSAVSLRVHKQ